MACATPLPVFTTVAADARGLDTHDALCRLTCRDADIHCRSTTGWSRALRAPAAVEDVMRAFEGPMSTLPMVRSRAGRGGRGQRAANLSAVVCRWRDTSSLRVVAHPMLQWLLHPRPDFTPHRSGLNGFVRQWLPADQAGHRLVPHAIPQDRQHDPVGSRGSSPLAGRIANRFRRLLIAVAGFGTHCATKEKQGEGAAGCRDCSGSVWWVGVR